MKRLALKVAGVIFSIFALMHLLRVLYHWQMMIAGYEIPESASVVALIVAGILAIWMFVAAVKKS